MNQPPPPRGPIVSSEHLATAEGWQFSELEYGMIMAFNAFSRRNLRCMAAVGHPDFNPPDIRAPHTLSHRRRDKRLADVAFVLNIEDLHTVNYAVKKLVKAGLAEGEKRGKEMFWRATPEGRRVCAEYGKARELRPPGPAGATDTDFAQLARAAQAPRSVAGDYDQAARAAAIL